MANLPTTLNTQIEIIDPFQESVNALIVIAFPKSSSKNFAVALNLAQGASKYALTEIGGTQMHFAAFARNKTDAVRASALLTYINGWKGTMLFSRGKVIPNSYLVYQIIYCYLESCSCRDYKAHCQTIIDDPFSPESQNTRSSMHVAIRIGGRPPLTQEIQIDRYAFPCKHLLNRFRFQKDHPSSPQDQIQAAGVSEGCDMCPHFKPDDFQVVGTRTIKKEFFD